MLIFLLHVMYNVSSISDHQMWSWNFRIFEPFLILPSYNTNSDGGEMKKKSYRKEKETTEVILNFYWHTSSKCLKRKAIAKKGEWFVYHPKTKSSIVFLMSIRILSKFYRRTPIIESHKSIEIL